MNKQQQQNNFPKVVFGFNKDWELKNWEDSCFKKISYDSQGKKKWDLGGIPQEVEELIEVGGEERVLRLKIKDIFNKFSETVKAKQIIKDTTERAEKRWNNVGEKCFLALSKMLDIPIEDFEEKYRVYFTFGKRCPFGQNSFMFNQFSDFPNTASHEIMHIEFLKRYKQYCLDKGLSEEQINHLKEILTVLLNEDLKDILYLTDKGYDSHKESRKKVLKLYREHKKTKESFKNFLDKVIELIKKNY